MSSFTGTAGSEVEGGRELKDRRARRTRPLQGMARKISQEIARLEETVRLEETRNAEDHERVRAICNTAFGGSFSRILKSSPVLSDSDREFLREMSYF